MDFPSSAEFFTQKLIAPLHEFIKYSAIILCYNVVVAIFFFYLILMDELKLGATFTTIQVVNSGLSQKDLPRKRLKSSDTIWCRPGPIIHG
jgi:hypothetical protein